MLGYLDKSIKALSRLAWVRSMQDPAWKSKMGSAQEFGERGILGCFLESDEFRLGYRHPLRLQEQIAQILIAPTAS